MYCISVWLQSRKCIIWNHIVYRKGGTLQYCYDILSHVSVEGRGETISPYWSVVYMYAYMYMYILYKYPPVLEVYLDYVSSC